MQLRFHGSHLRIRFPNLDNDHVAVPLPQLYFTIFELITAYKLEILTIEINPRGLNIVSLMD